MTEDDEQNTKQMSKIPRDSSWFLPFGKISNSIAFHQVDDEVLKLGFFISFKNLSNLVVNCVIVWVNIWKSYKRDYCTFFSFGRARNDYSVMEKIKFVSILVTLVACRQWT